jgi:hypothetical protein
VILAHYGNCAFYVALHLPIARFHRRAVPEAVRSGMGQLCLQDWQLGFHSQLRSRSFDPVTLSTGVRMLF